jgi:hypothetical protein
LWTVERSNHQTTNGQLGDAQAEFRQVQLDLTGVTETLRIGIKQQLDAGRAMVQATDARDDKKYRETIDVVARLCR